MKKRHCFICKVKKTSMWYKYTKEYYLCNSCYKYKRNFNGYVRKNGFWYTKTVYPLSINWFNYL